LRTHETIEAILNGTFKPRFWAEQLLPPILYAKDPQLADERRKRAHRKAYRAPRGAAASALFAAQRTTQLEQIPLGIDQAR